MAGQTARTSEVMYARFRDAATNWRLALRFDQATRVEAKANEVAKMSEADRYRVNRGAALEDLWKKDPIVSSSANPFGDLIPTPSPTARIRKALPVETAERPTYDSKGWTEESTHSAEIGPWLKYSPTGTRY